MRRALYKPPAKLADLSWIEAKLKRSRRRFSKLLKWWVPSSAFLVFVALTNADNPNPDGRMVPFVLILGTGIWVAQWAARVFVNHPRLLAAQREQVGEGLQSIDGDQDGGGLGVLHGLNK